MEDTGYIEAGTIPFMRHKREYKKYASEALGTFIFVFIALATVNQTVLSAIYNKTDVSQLIIAFGFGIGLAVGVQLVGPISGAHLNPAVSFAFCLFKKLSLTDMVFYMLAQMFGAFFAALLVYCLYYNLISRLDYNVATASMFGTVKMDQTSIVVGLLEQVIGTALLMFGVARVVKYGKYVSTLIGVILFTLALCMGNNGFAFNPARDLGPRMMTLIFWGVDVFKYGSHWFWVPVVGPCIGAPLGLLLDVLFEYIETV